jgi:predicted Zn-dependent peptidase
VRSFDRKIFTNYIESHYHAGNAVVVIAGGFEGKPSSYYIDLIREKFNKWNTKEKTGFEKYVETQKDIQKKVFYKKTEQAHFCLGFKAFPFTDKSRYPLSILSAILGGGMSSRLFIEVRERRGLCYYISTGRELFEDTGYLVTQAGVTNDKDKVNEAIKVTR